MAQSLVRAHQYLYYVKSTPVLSDWDYDLFCKEHGIDGGGGSSLESSYSAEDRRIAEFLLKKYGQSTT
jgi:NAD-dependent DNA ligase